MFGIFLKLRATVLRVMGSDGYRLGCRGINLQSLSIYTSKTSVTYCTYICCKSYSECLETCMEILSTCLVLPPAD